MCFNNGLSQNFIQSYYLIGHNVPIVLNASNPSLGISKESITLTDNFVSCRFTRQKSISGNPYYANVTANQFYILTAYGIYDSATGTINLF